MHALHVVATFAVVAIFLYLIAALLFPERFE
jgi:K+-transporting ATPase KdpF subunit